MTFNISNQIDKLKKRKWKVNLCVRRVFKYSPIRRNFHADTHSAESASRKQRHSPKMRIW